MTQSRTFVHQAPTAEELAQQLDSADTELTAALEANLEEARRLREEMQELRRELMEEEEIGWEEKAALEELLKAARGPEGGGERMQEENRKKNEATQANSAQRSVAEEAGRIAAPHG